MARTKHTLRKSTAPKWVPRHQLAPRYEIGESSSNPTPDPQAEIARLRAELERAEADRIADANEINHLRDSLHTREHQRNDALARVETADERIEELVGEVAELEDYAEMANDENQRLNNLLDPEYQRQAAQDDLGLVMGEDEEEYFEEVESDNDDVIIEDELYMDEEGEPQEEEAPLEEEPEVVEEDPEEEEDPEIVEWETEEEEEEELVPVSSGDDDYGTDDWDVQEWRCVI